MADALEVSDALVELIVDEEQDDDEGADSMRGSRVPITLWRKASALPLPTGVLPLLGLDRPRPLATTGSSALSFSNESARWS